RRTVATSPGSAVPSETLEQTPEPGNPGVSQAEFSLELHFWARDGSLFGSGSHEVQIGSAEPSSVSSTAAIARLPTALMLCATFVIPDAVWLQTILEVNCTRSSGVASLLSSSESGSQ